MHPQARQIGIVFTLTLLLASVGCGRSAKKMTITSSGAGFHVGGSIVGLGDGEHVVLHNQGDLPFPAAGSSYQLPALLPSGSQYDVAVLQSPSGKSCTVQNPSGTVASQDIDNVSITCSPNSSPLYNVGGQISGLASGESLLINNNGGVAFSVSGSSYTLSSPLPQGAQYSIGVVQAPSGKICQVSNASGSVPAADVSNVDIACSAGGTNGGSNGGTNGGTNSGSNGSGLVNQPVILNAAPRPGQIALTWTNSGNPPSITIDVRRAPYPYGEASFETVKTLTQGETTYTDTSVVANTQYRYRIRANNPTDPNANGVSLPWDVTASPNQPVILSATADASSVALSWSNSGNPNTISIDVRRAVYPFGDTNFSTIKTFTNGETSFTDAGLSANTQYRYRIRANHPIDPSANAVSEYRDATTGSAPPPAVVVNKPILGSALPRTDGVHLAWNNNGNPASITIDVRRGVSPYGEANYQTVRTLTQGETSYLDNSAAPNTAYRYRIRANHPTDPTKNGVSDPLDVVSSPSKPVILSATPASSSIALSWSNSGNPVSISIDIRRAVYPYGDTNYVTVKTLTNGETSFNDTGLAANTAYRYRIRANHPTDANANSVSDYKDVTTGTAPPPAIVVNKPILSSAAPRTDGVHLAWSNNGNPASITIDVRRGVYPYGESNYSTVKTLTQGETSYLDNGVSPNTAYRYRIRANHPTDPTKNGVSDPLDALSSPAKPVIVSATPASSSVSLSWSNSGNPAGITIDVRRGVSPFADSNYSTVKTLTNGETSFTDAGLSANTQYRYRIRANHPTDANASSVSDYKDATTGAAPPPAVVVNKPVLGSAAPRTDGVHLAWSNSGNPASITIDVRRGVYPYGESNYVTVKTLSQGETSYLDSSAAPNTAYRYRIRANHPTDPTKSAVSDPLDVTTSPAAPVLSSALPRSNGVILSWSNSGNTASVSIDVRRGIYPYGESNFVTVAHLVNGQTTYTDSAVTTNTAYRYRIRANHPSDANANAVSNALDVTTSPNAPTLGSVSATSTSVTLGWTSNNPASVTVSVMRAPITNGVVGSFSTLVQLGNAATSWTDSGVSRNTSYRYRIRANHPYDSNANVSSNYLEVTTKP